VFALGLPLTGTGGERIKAIPALIDFSVELLDWDGFYFHEFTPGYYLYQQLTRAGRRGMGVVECPLPNPVSNLIAFAGRGSGHPDAFMLARAVRIWKLSYAIRIQGSPFRRFKAYRTTQDGEEKFQTLGVFENQKWRTAL
jgi:hypothetical protein